MQLFYSTASPYVRKVMVCALELGLDGRIEKTPASVSPLAPVEAVVQRNPLGKLPTLVTDDGLALFDSRVICEYLDNLGGGGRLFPRESSRWQALVEQAAADGMLDAGILIRYETAMRPEEAHRSAKWVEGQMGKAHASLDQMDKWAAGFGARVDIGTISVGCALGWFDFRFGDVAWRAKHPALAAWFETFAKRPSMASTAPHA